MRTPFLKNKVAASFQLAGIMLLMATFCFKAKAQTPKLKTQIVPGTDIYKAVQHQAEFPGGSDGFGNYLARTIKYPKSARDKNIQGKVFLQFVVEKNGSLSGIKVLRGIGAGCDEEAVKAMENGPKWTPGKQDGQIVRSMFTVPIQFSLAKG